VSVSASRLVPGRRSVVAEFSPQSPSATAAIHQRFDADQPAGHQANAKQSCEYGSHALSIGPWPPESSPPASRFRQDLRARDKEFVRMAWSRRAPGVRSAPRVDQPAVRRRHTRHSAFALTGRCRRPDALPADARSGREPAVWLTSGWLPYRRGGASARCRWRGSGSAGKRAGSVRCAIGRRSHDRPASSLAPATRPRAAVSGDAGGDARVCLNAAVPGIDRFRPRRCCFLVFSGAFSPVCAQRRSGEALGSGRSR
jgi:hypothetical protein